MLLYVQQRTRMDTILVLDRRLFSASPYCPRDVDIEILETCSFEVFLLLLSMLQLTQLKLGRADNSVGRSVCLPECDSDTDASGPSLFTVGVVLVDNHCYSMT